MRNISQLALGQVLLPKVDLTRQTRALDAFADLAEGTRRIQAQAAKAEAQSQVLGRSILAAAFSGRLVTAHHGVSEIQELITA